MTWNNQGGNGGGPWGKPGSSGGQRPNGGNRPPHGRPEPDLDDVLRQAQDRFQNMFGGKGRGGNGGNAGDGGFGGDGKNVITLVFVILMLVWAASGFYRVLPEEHGVIMTFGEWTDTRTMPGLGYHMPWPIQTVKKVNVTFERRVEVGFRERTGRNGETSDIPGESLMLTGDENIVDIDFVVVWQINDAGNYLFSIRDPESTVKKAAESAMREIIGYTKIQAALTESRRQIELDTKLLMQQMLDSYNSGITINDVQMQRVDPPAQVVDAFVDVQRARADMERLRNEAEAYRNKIIPEARGQAKKLTEDAAAYKESNINKAKGDADRFSSVYKAYAESKDITTRRMYIETLQNMLQKSNKIIIGNGENGSSVFPYLPLDKIRKQ